MHVSQQGGTEVRKYLNQRPLGGLGYYLGLEVVIMFVSFFLFVRAFAFNCMHVHLFIFMDVDCLYVFGTGVSLFRPAVLTKEAWEFHVNCEDCVTTGIPGGGCQEVIEPYSGTDCLFNFHL